MVSTVARATVAATPAVRLREAGAVMGERGGHAVPAHYGSIAGELAVCFKRAGIADRSDLETLELRGREAWLEHALTRATGGRAPLPGRAVRLGGAWCARLDADRALLVGRQAALARWCRVARDGIVAGSAIAYGDLEDAPVPISVVGPRSDEVLAGAGLAVAGLAAGDVREDRLAGAPVTLLREDHRRTLLLVTPRAAETAWRALLAAGRPVGLTFVGCDALDRLAASAPLGLAG